MPRILIVDDEKSIRLTLGKFLADAGHEILTAEDADTGLALLKQHVCDLVISDIVLPRVTGVELLKAIHAQSPDLPVVMMTGEPALETAVEAVRAGAFDYLSKPINKPAIMRVVEQALRMRALQQEKARLEEANRQYRQNLERMVAERTWALRESEARLRTLFNEAPIGIWEQDFSAVQARFEELRATGVQDFLAYFTAHPDETARCAALIKSIEVNQTGVRLFGAASKQDLPHQFSALFTADSPAVFARELAALAQGLPRFEAEFPVRTIAKEEKSLYLILVVVPGHAAKLDRVLVSFVDVTERKKTEQALALSEDRYRNLVESASDWVWEVDATGHYSYASHKVFDLLGYSPEQVIGRTPFDLMPPDEARRVSGLFAAIVAEKRPFTALENVNLHKNGREVVLETSGTPFFDFSGRYAGYRGMDRDITERKQAEIALRASEERFHTLVDHAPNGIYIQTNLRFVYVNLAALELFGARTPDELIGCSVMDRVHPEWHSAVIERVRRVTENQEPVPRMEQRYLRLDGRVFDVEVQALPFIFDGLNGSLVFFTDITERKRLAEQLRQSQKLDAIGQLAGGVAHDFNNILAAILMHLGLLQENPALDAETRASLKELEKESRRAANLTRQLLLFSRRSVMQPRPVDINEVVGEMFKMLRRLLGEQITFEYSGKNGLPLIEADPGMIEQVVLNLCVNARDAMPKGGRLRVGTDVVELAASQLTRLPGARPGKFVRLIVTDNGCGMDEVTQQRIFEPFFTTKEAGKGTGLGLATVHGIVSQHRGWVEVVSAPDQGATFTVILPATDKLAEVESRAEASQPIVRGTETILLVEDEPGVRLTIGQFLRRTGYHVLEAANGVAALTLWRQHRPGIHLLFTDMVMPEGMTGLELAERLLAEKANLKVIITSGYSADLLNLGKLASGILYLPKPTPPARLAAAVRECLDGKTK